MSGALQRRGASVQPSRCLPCVPGLPAAPSLLTASKVFILLIVLSSAAGSIELVVATAAAAAAGVLLRLLVAWPRLKVVLRLCTERRPA